MTKKGRITNIELGSALQMAGSFAQIEITPVIRTFTDPDGNERTVIDTTYFKAEGTLSEQEAKKILKYMINHEINEKGLRAFCRKSENDE